MKIVKKIIRLVLFVINKIINPIGLVLERDISKKQIEYKENPAAGYANFSEKLARLESGGPLEWPNMQALNKAIGQFIGNSKKVVNIGAGTGTFEYYAAPNLKDTQFIASEFDNDCIEWNLKNRAQDNIVYCSKSMTDLLNEYQQFDLAVTVDVIEHITDYGAFLKEFSELADKAIITTPNKARTYGDLLANPPIYYQHIREWTPGEFYWVLKMFYSEVTLYGMPDPNIAELSRIGLFSKMTPMIAVCKK